jgi:23S rRNA (guanosine2251-2'-O)-methyltransferase
MDATASLKSIVMKSKFTFGFHAVTSRIRFEASSVDELYIDAERHDRRMSDLLQVAKAAGVRVIHADDQRLSAMVGTAAIKAL